MSERQERQERQGGVRSDDVLRNIALYDGDGWVRTIAQDALDARKERDAALSTVGEMREWIEKHNVQCQECFGYPGTKWGHTDKCSVPRLLAVPTPALEEQG